MEVSDEKRMMEWRVQMSQAGFTFSWLMSLGWPLCLPDSAFSLLLALRGMIET
jgi:hypothetical protein